MKFFTTTVILLLAFGTAMAQVKRDIIPVSFFYQELLSSPPENVLPELNLAEAERMDKEDAKNNKEPVFARPIYTNITLDNSGNWSELPNGDRVWRVMITSQGARALVPYFNQFYLPPGSALHVYTPAKDEVIGAFTDAINPADGYYCTGIIHGESFILEYDEPKEVRGQGKLSMNEVCHAYKKSVEDFFPKSLDAANSEPPGYLQSGSCEVNVNCSEGDSFRNQQRSVVYIILLFPDGEHLCSGSMINDVKGDCTPYVLTAQHVIGDTAAPNYSTVLFYFNYQSPTCANPSPSQEASLTSQFITGCSHIADSNDDGGTTGSDFLLLKLNQNPPSSYNVYYEGWDRTDTPSTAGVCIHHPSGDIAKISTYTKPVISASFGAVPNTHWAVTWSPTAHGYGVTEDGSSGSPLFNSAGQIVGQLSGGGSACGLPDDTMQDYFGKIWYDWKSDGSVSAQQLQPWLDPANTGATSIAGRDATCALAVTNVASPVFHFNVLPNPSTGLFHLSFDDNNQRTISVYDIMGRKLQEIKSADKLVTVDLTSQGKGIYLVQAEIAGNSEVQKLVLQ